MDSSGFSCAGKSRPEGSFLGSSRFTFHFIRLISSSSFCAFQVI